MYAFTLDVFQHLAARLGRECAQYGEGALIVEGGDLLRDFFGWQHNQRLGQGFEHRVAILFERLEFAIEVLLQRSELSHGHFIGCYRDCSAGRWGGQRFARDRWR